MPRRPRRAQLFPDGPLARGRRQRLPMMCLLARSWRRRRPIQTCAIVYTDGDQMAKAIVTKSPATGRRRRAAGRRAGWVRKNVVMDQRKLDVARRALGVDTETEAIDQALDFVAFREELAKGFAAVRRSGGVEDVVDGRRRA